MKKIVHISLILAALAGLASCDEKMITGVKATGGTSELLVVTESPEMWQGIVGDSVRAVFGRTIYGLPQPEPLYDFIHTSKQKFQNNPLFATHSLILILDKDSLAAKSTIDVQRNVRATPQIVITLKGASDTALVKVVSFYSEAMIELMKKNQYERILNLVDVSTNREATQKLRQTFGIEILIPGSFTLAIHNKTFAWLRQSAHRKKQDTELGLLLYSQPYTDTAQFSLKKIIRLRDSIGYQYIKGPTSGSFMESAVEDIPPVSITEENQQTGYRAITKGLWMIKKDFMGGAFVNYTLLNKKTNTLLTAEGYVYNPNGEKRNYMIQLEAIIQNIKWAETISDNIK